MLIPLIVDTLDDYKSDKMFIILLASSFIILIVSSDVLFFENGDFMLFPLLMKGLLL